MPPHVGDSDEEWSTDSDGEESSFRIPSKSLFPVPSAMRTPQRQVRRADSLPPLSSSGPRYSSPIVGTKAEKLAKTRQKAQKKRASTIAQKNAALAAAIPPLPPSDSAGGYSTGQLAAMSSSLNELQEHHNLSFNDLMAFVFDPIFKQGNQRYAFFRTPGTAIGILNHWVSPYNSDTGREIVHRWATEYLGSTVRSEAQGVTESGMLQMRYRELNTNLVASFSFERLFSTLCDKLPTVVSILRAFVSPVRTLQKATTARVRRAETILTSVLVQCLGQYSQSNNIFKRIFGLYLYATGTQRQSLTVLSHLGLSESYSGVVAKKRKRRKKKKKTNVQSSTDLPASISPDTVGTELGNEETIWTKGGSLRQLSDTMRKTYRSVASTGLFAGVYDNINWMSKVAEQSLGRKNQVESGTCSTIWPLYKATTEDIMLEPVLNAFDSAPPLSLDDLLHTPEEAELFRRCLAHTIIRIIVEYGGDGFKRFAKDLAGSAPTTPDKIERHQTPLHPVTAFDIDESTIVGNGHFTEAFYSELDVIRHTLFDLWAKFLGGDQLSIARLRALFNIRVGHERGFRSFNWGIWMPGLFHAKIADTHGFLFTHWGKPDCGSRNPGSLWFHNTCLHRLPLKLSSLPTFRVCRDLIFVSLYARVLHCLLLVADVPSLDAYLIKFSSFESLQQHASQILDQYANSTIVNDLRWQRRQSGAAEGDMVFENAILFLRDALISREFAYAVKAGDSGRAVLVLKVWALAFRGNGRTKYAYEMLHIIHNITKVWPKRVAIVVLNNWLVNPTGYDDGFVEIDLMQEHHNFWIKTFYKAHGSAASWDWLAMISPCINILRRITTTMHKLLGSHQGVYHAKADLQHDIFHVLMPSLAEHQVYELKKGRVVDSDDAPVPDIIETGLHALTDSSHSPLDEYNKTFLRLQARQRLAPILSVNKDPDTMPQDPIIPPVLQTTVPVQIDDGEESEPEEEEESDFFRVMDDEEEPTLLRLTQDDVALDMDEYEDSDQGEDSSDDNEDLEDGDE